MQAYIKQGVKAVYVPITGAYKFFHPLGAPCSNPHKITVDFMIEHKNNDKGMIVSNSLNALVPTIYITSPKVLNEFYIKEVEYYKRIPLLNSIVNKMFFYEGGPQSIKLKGVWANFFKYDNVVKIMPGIQQIVFDRVKSLKKTWKEGEDLKTWKKFDLHHFLKDTFDDIVHITMLGEYNPEKVPKVDGLALSQAIEKYMNCAFGMVKKPAHPLTFGLSSRFGLTKIARTYHKIEKKLVEETKILLLNRLDNPKETINIIDQMHNWNKQCDAPGGDPTLKMDLVAMISNLFFFYAAGTDTSRSASSSGYYLLSAHKEIKERVIKDFEQSLFGGDVQSFIDNPKQHIDYDKAPVLDMFVKELLRLWGPSTMSHYRTCTKSHKLNGVTIHKNTRLNFCPVGFHKDPDYFTNPNTINIDRFTEENMQKIKRRTYIPFGEGYRKCSGVYLGYNLVKCCLIALLSHFEIGKQEDFDPKWIIQFAIDMPKIELQMRPRSDVKF
jgi:cytochrome P450